MIIYQLFPRVYGATPTKRCGTFSDISDDAIERIKSLSVSHIWLTGVIRHSGWRDTNPAVTKGKAGSPYAIVDYYDIDPDLADNEANRMEEFEQTVERIHNHGLKVIIDFVPNHLAREYKGDFTDENFYILENQKFVAPTENASDYYEFPAKATGNDVFSPTPSLNDWYDTVKLNYTNRDTWHKMLKILEFWCGKGVDGFRCDMAEMVPVEFWRWAIAELRKSFSVIMIAEIYQPNLYQNFIDAGFDYLYDKVGLYNTLENIYRYGQRADSISDVWKGLNGLDDNMLRFMENHDEVRLASKFFMQKPENAYPFVALSALMNRGPFMIYNGQEYGEDAADSDNGKTSIFNYEIMQSMVCRDAACHVHTFDFYVNLLHFRESHSAILQGGFYDLMWANPWYNNFDPQYVYAFLRYHDDDKLLIVINFNLKEERNVTVTIPYDARQLIGGCNEKYDVKLSPGNIKIIQL
ncbi:MAG: alpha-amylase [Bacteroidales bacterium]|nr:alpha-amylase [Bacteroidales bacterium]